MSIVQRALKVVRQQDRKIRGVTVTYEQHDGTTFTIKNAVPTAPRTEVITEAGVSVDRRLDDWILEVTDLLRLPEKGDGIIYNGEEYQVMHPGGGREYDYHDSYNDSLRVHTVVMPRSIQEPAGYGNANGILYANPNNIGYGKSAG